MRPEKGYLSRWLSTKSRISLLAACSILMTQQTVMADEVTLTASNLHGGIEMQRSMRGAVLPPRAARTQKDYQNKPGTNIHRKTTYQGMSRDYMVHLPPGYTGQAPLPLVILLHSGAATSKRMIRVSGMLEKADREHFIVLAPNGTGLLKKALLTWNSGKCCGFSVKRNIDDVGFIDKILDQVESDFNIDTDRIYATGESNGGMLAYKLACDLSHRIAAIAPVAASMDGLERSPEQPVSIVAFNGTDDGCVLYNGGVGKALVSRVKVFSKSVAYAVQFWVKNNGCAPKSEKRKIGNVIAEKYSGGKGDSEVLLYTIDGGKHAWPGGEKNWLLGDKPTTEISATDAMWDFFMRHPKQSTVVAMPANSIVKNPATQIDKN
jgi:polyhydroxybutyrate depolymerase